MADLQSHLMMMEPDETLKNLHTAERKAKPLYKPVSSERYALAHSVVEPKVHTTLE